MDRLSSTLNCLQFSKTAWLAFSNLLKKNAWTEPTHYGEELSKYLNSSCMPGVLDQDREPISTNITSEKVCGLCDTNSTSGKINQKLRGNKIINIKLY